MNTLTSAPPLRYFSVMAFAKPFTSPKAFSLVEVALALGIVSIALVPLLGLLPVGLSTFRSSIDTNVFSQVVEKLGNEAQLSEFDGVTSSGLRYFDEQGNEVSQKALAVYQARLTVVTPAQPEEHRKRLIIQVVRKPAGAITNLKEDTLEDAVVWSNQNALPIATRTLLLARMSKAASP